ncbi:MAG: hypothetical protein ACYS8W_04615 [Planctomycetota bacterium]
MSAVNFLLHGGRQRIMSETGRVLKLRGLENTTNLAQWYKSAPILSDSQGCAVKRRKKMLHKGWSWLPVSFKNVRGWDNFVRAGGARGAEMGRSGQVAALTRLSDENGNGGSQIAVNQRHYSPGSINIKKYIN